jgi:hypothetical protein
MKKYSCTVLRNYGEPFNSTQPFKILNVNRLRSVLDYVKKLNRRYLKRKIRYTVQVVKQI